MVYSQSGNEQKIIETTRHLEKIDQTRNLYYDFLLEEKEEKQWLHKVISSKLENLYRQVQQNFDSHNTFSYLWEKILIDIVWRNNYLF